MKIAVANLKGGTAKTTTASFLAQGLSKYGPTLLVDADEQGSALSWSETPEEDGSSGSSVFDFPVVGLPVKDVHKKIAQMEAGYDHIVIDTPPGDRSIVRSALLAADVAILAVTPGVLDLDRMRPTLELVAEIEHINELSLYVLLTKVKRISREGRDAREAMVDLEIPVLDAEIPLLQFYSESFGAPIRSIADYEALISELARKEQLELSPSGSATAKTSS